ncbi:Hsp20/alpha crystallin family protein [Planosporangium thailandense]|uniref:Hsp20/alpha crystallin family protein n=1 Tax=Planosporangium thailandense TaxID=765197 RepID=A0ABX0Y4T0_9ACTN|nr:Hsp20/alpha crystallin family protein [Planosporangium thailandense]NJC73106.1 Hsp20/alpha crystallin family protein [Planosporangium thailandense]
MSNIEINRHTEINLEVDEEKLQAIRSCLEKGRLSIRMSNVDLSQAGRLQAPYLYD